MYMIQLAAEKQPLKIRSIPCLMILVQQKTLVVLTPKNHNLDNARFVNVTSRPLVGEHLAAKYYVDETISNGEVES